MPTFRQSLRYNRINESDDFENSKKFKMNRQPRLFEGNSMRDSKLFKDIENVAKKYNISLRLAEFNDDGLRLQAYLKVKGEPVFSLEMDGDDQEVIVSSENMRPQFFEDFVEYAKNFEKFIEFVMKLDEDDYV